MVSFKQSAGENRLLATLAGRDRQRLFADFERVELSCAEVICGSGERIEHVYFPTDGIISLVTALRDGSRLEVGSIGHEGMLGSSLILGVDTSAQYAIVQRSGTAWRLGAAVFQRHLRENIALRRRLNCYMYVLMGQLAQSTACSHYHQVRARLARRLLMNRDQVRGNQFHVTQEFLAHMLGVRRVGVTNAANSLREEGLIDYRRGPSLFWTGLRSSWRPAHAIEEQTTCTSGLWVHCPCRGLVAPTRHRRVGRRTSSVTERALRTSAKTAAFIFPSPHSSSLLPIVWPRRVDGLALHGRPCIVRCGGAGSGSAPGVQGAAHGIDPWILAPAACVASPRRMPAAFVCSATHECSGGG